MNHKMANQIPKLKSEQPWSLAIERDLESYQALDEHLLQKVMCGEEGPAICLSRHPRCLVATVRESRMDGFEAACAQLTEQGWPVRIRCTGGTCVPQGPGVLNLALIHPRQPGWKLEDDYLLLGDLLTRLLASFGLNAAIGSVPGSFCDGRYNLQVGGLKLVGTAQRWAGNSREQAAVLAHACLLVDLDLIEATEKINLLYRLCGNSQQFDPAACTTLRACLGGSGEAIPGALPVEVERRLTELVRQNFKLC